MLAKEVVFGLFDVAGSAIGTVASFLDTLKGGYDVWKAAQQTARQVQLNPAPTEYNQAIAFYGEDLRTMPLSQVVAETVTFAQGTIGLPVDPKIVRSQLLDYAKQNNISVIGQ